MTRNQTDIADFIINEIKSFASQSLRNRMPTPDKDIIFDKPLVQFADGDDPLLANTRLLSELPTLPLVRHWYRLIIKLPKRYPNAFR